jgi:TIR domain
MSLLFISHANEDKHRIKCITDALLGGSYRLWIDSPHVMGYTPDEIAGRIYHILGGRSWQEEIDAGIRAADCVILLASQRLRGSAQRRIAGMWRRPAARSSCIAMETHYRLDTRRTGFTGIGLAAPPSAGSASAPSIGSSWCPERVALAAR